MSGGGEYIRNYTKPVLKEDPPVDPLDYNPEANISEPPYRHDSKNPTGKFEPLGFEEDYIGEAMHLVPKVPPREYCHARKYMRTKHEKRGTIDIFLGYCRQTSGWGVEDVDKGRCKPHFGKALQASPDKSHNQDRLKTFREMDPHHYIQSLGTEEQEYLREAEASILDRIRDRQGDPDYLDRILARRIAVQLHIVAKESNHVENVSGLTQELTREEGDQQEVKAALLDDIRKRDKDIISMLKDIGVLHDPESKKANALSDWKSYLEAGEEDEDEIIDV